MKLSETTFTMLNWVLYRQWMTSKSNGFHLEVGSFLHRHASFDTWACLVNNPMAASIVENVVSVIGRLAYFFLFQSLLLLGCPRMKSLPLVSWKLLSSWSTCKNLPCYRRYCAEGLVDQGIVGGISYNISVPKSCSSRRSWPWCSARCKSQP